MKPIINLYQKKNDALDIALERIIVNVHLAKERGNLKSFLLCGSEPRVGTTTVAINMALSMATLGWKTVLVDGDFRKDIQYKRLNTNLPHDLTQYLRGEKELSDVVYATSMENLDYIPCSSDGDNPISLLCFSRFDEMVDTLEQHYDYVIFDFPSLGSTMDAAIIAAKTDAVLLVTAQFASSAIFRESKKRLDNSGANIIGVIVNKLDEREYKKNERFFDYFSKERYAKRANVAKKRAKKARKTNEERGSADEGE